MNITIFTNMRLGGDPKVSYNGDKCFARFSGASKKSFFREGESDTNWFNIICFGKTAEFVEKYLHKGSKVNVYGEPTNNSYTNRDGIKIDSVEFIANKVEFAESKADSEKSRQAAPNTPPKAEPQEEKEEDFSNVVDDDELPFN